MEMDELTSTAIELGVMEERLRIMKALEILKITSKKMPEGFFSKIVAIVNIDQARKK